MWFEAAVRINSSGLPLEKVCTVRPIAMSTGHGLWLFEEEVQASAEFARELAVAGNVYFTFLDQRDLKSSLIRVMSMLDERLEQNFGTSPLEAKRALEVKSNAGELVFIRDHQKSQVIGRESWLPAIFNSAYETSTYTVKWFSSDKPEMTSTTEHGFFGKGAEETFGRNVFIEIEHVFLISADGTAYRETISPASQMETYMSAYRRAIQEAFSKSLRDTCNRGLAGKAMMVNGICEVRGDVQ